MDKYSYSVDLNSNSAAAIIIRNVKEGAKVLELGAGPGSICNVLKRQRNCTVHACEIDPGSVAILKQNIDKVFSSDLNSDTWDSELSPEKYDYVILADVLEHLYDPLRTLKKAAGLLGDSSRLLISLPHVHHMTVAGSYFSNNFEYGEWGLLDKTHIRFFGLKNMDELFAQAGLVAEQVEFVIMMPEETEFGAQWQKLSSHVRWMLKRKRSGYVYQVVTQLRRTRAGEAAGGVKVSEQKITIPFKKWLRSNSCIRSCLRLIPQTVKNAIRAVRGRRS